VAVEAADVVLHLDSVGFVTDAPRTGLASAEDEFEVVHTSLQASLVVGMEAVELLLLQRHQAVALFPWYQTQ
jgi:hypothetical protein